MRIVTACALLMIMFLAPPSVYGLQTAGITTAGALTYPNLGITHLGRIQLDSGDENLLTIGLDSRGEYAFFLSGYSQKLIKVALNEGANPGQRLCSMTIDNTTFHNRCALIDPAGGCAYVGMTNDDSYDRRGRVYKVALGVGDAPPRTIGMVEFPLSDFSGMVSGGIDSKAGFAYFCGSNYATGGPIVKIRMGLGDTAPTLASLTYLNAGDDYLSGALLDDQAGYGYFYGGYGDPAFVMVGLGAGAPYRIGAINFRISALGLALLDKPSGHIYVFENYDGYYGEASRFYKFKLGTGGALPAYLNHISLEPSEENWTGAGVLDPVAQWAILRANEYAAQSSHLVKIDLGAGDSAPTRLGRITLPEGDLLDSKMTMDPASGYLYGAANYHKPSEIVRLGLSRKGLLQGTRFTLKEKSRITEARLYSHRTGGAVRLAIYNDLPTTRTLLWQSEPMPNNVAGGWLVAPVATGQSQALYLDAGNYFIAWQTDTSADFTGYQPGEPGCGFFVPKRYGAFPEILAGDTPTSWTSTNDAWSVHVTCESTNGARNWRMYH